MKKLWGRIFTLICLSIISIMMPQYIEASQSDVVNKIENYLCSSGTKSTGPSYFVQYSEGENTYSIIYQQNNNVIQFSSQQGYYYVNMDYSITDYSVDEVHIWLIDTSTAKPTEADCIAAISMDTYKTDDTLSFENQYTVSTSVYNKVSNNKTLYNNCNAIFKNCMYYWDTGLTSYTGLTLSDLGFLNYDSASSVINSGSAGDDVTWTLYVSGKMVFSGSGPMANYTDSTGYPWFCYYEDTKSVILENGVTSVGNYAFQLFYNVKDVAIADSVTSIGNEAFIGCSALKSIKLSNNLKTIGKNAFKNCTIYFNSCSQKAWDSIKNGSYTNTELVLTGKHKLSRTKAVAATYDKAGCREYYTCSVCGSIFSDAAGKNAAVLKNLSIPKLTINKPSQPTIKYLKSTKTKTLTLKWGKLSKNCKGYEIQLASNSKFTKNKKSVKITTYKTVSNTVKKLKKGMKYYVRIRAYNSAKVSGKTKMVYSSWSKVKTVKVK